MIYFFGQIYQSKVKYKYLIQLTLTLNPDTLP